MGGVDRSGLAAALAERGTTSALEEPVIDRTDIHPSLGDDFDRMARLGWTDAADRDDETALATVLELPALVIRAERV